MNTLFVYGDSYSSSQTDSIGYGWAAMLANSIDYNLENKAVSGCSTHYQFLKFIEDYKEDRFKKDDIIIFQSGYPERYHFEHQRKDPDSANYNSNTRWVKKNKKYLDWYMANFDYDHASCNQGMVPHVLRSIAEARPDLNIVYLEVVSPKFSFPLASVKNFLTFNFNLHTVSIAEFDGFDFPDWFKKIDIDLRVNHMCLENCKILAEIIEDAYKNKKVQHNASERFLKKVFHKPIENETEVVQAAEQGLIYQPHYNTVINVFKFF